MVFDLRKYVKFVLMFSVVSFGLVFAGCSGGSEDAKTSGIFGGGSSKGTSSSSGKGVELSFGENAPPAEMFKGNGYNFAFVFKNNYKFPITDLKVKVKGFDRGFVSGLEESYSVPEIPAASKQAGVGVYQGLVVSGVKVDSFVGNYNFNPIFDYAYSGKSTFTEQVCVPSKKNTCDVSVTASTEKNGALVLSLDRVNSVEDTVRFEFSVANSGGGQVVNEFFNTDNYAPSYTLNSAVLGTTTGTCKAVGSSDYQVISNKALFYCDFARSGDDSYASQISVEIGYKYQQSLKKSILVKSLD